MAPAYQPGDMLLVEKICFRFRQPQVGEVVVFKNENQRWVKRVLEVTERGYWVGGDNLADSKNPGLVTKSQLVGRVLKTVT